MDLKNKYLYKRNNIYYFSKRINGKPYKVSLGSDCLEYCQKLRDEIMKDFNKNDRYIIIGDKNVVAKTPEDYRIEALTYHNDVKEKALEIVAQTIGKATAPVQPIQEDDKNTPDIYANFDQYYTDYIEHRKTFDKISKSSEKTYNASMKYLKYFITSDTTFNFKFFKELQKNLQQLPKNFFKYPKYYQKSFDELSKVKEIESYETLDNKTINNHMNSYKLFFKYLKYEEVIDENPLNDIIPLNIEKTTNKEEFTKDELDAIFGSNLDKEYKNMCLVALYCGLRIEEVLSIKKKNIQNNFIHIELSDTGTKKHQRIIPIHTNILDTIAFQSKTNKGDFLFFDGNVANEVKNVGKRMNRRLDNIVPVKEKTFHSFRKNFSQELELNTTAEEKTKQYLMGHSFDNNITHSVYNRGKINTEKLVECIDQITFQY